MLDQFGIQCLINSIGHKVYCLENVHTKRFGLHETVSQKTLLTILLQLKQDSLL